jgi:hypothetical protein
MRRSLLSTGVVAALGFSLIGAPCGGPGPQSRTFAAGSLVIPMDRCYQRTTREAPPGGGVACNATGDDGVFRAYGLVYFLLKNGITVYWTIDPAKPPSGQVTGVDAAVPAPATGSVAQKMNWVNGTFADFGIPAGTGISYIGAPFAIDSADAAAVVDMLTNAANPRHADFARFQAEATRTTPAPVAVEIHKVQNGFTANQVRPLVGPPPRLAILNVNPLDLKTSVNVMYEYAVAAGLSWPCQGNGDCAGGVTGTGVNTPANPGQGCDLNALYAYLASPQGDPAIPQVPSPCGPTTVCAPKFNSGQGLIYDILCDNDFYAQSGLYADTKLAQNGYKLLWAPHWQEGGTTPSATPAVPPVTASDILGAQLQNIAAFVDAGNNLFAECHAIVTLEGGVGTSGTEVGLPATRFHSTTGMRSTNGTGAAPSFLVPSHPNVQIADFPYSLVGGSITTYYPDRAATPASVYRTGVERLITEAATPPWDISTLNRKDNVQTKGNVAYLGGHRYGPTQAGAGGQTAGTRLVLNTLFNLGIGCADPGTACNTGQLGICAAGTLRCATGGGLECVQTTPAAPAEICDNGLDDDCNGLVDEGCGPPPVCTDGAQRGCYEGGTGCTGPLGGPYTCTGVCQSGTQTCAGGAWGPCLGQVLPSPEVCNTRDDDCDGPVDDGTTCSPGYGCVQGICLPGTCGLEVAPCPLGYVCSAPTGGTCQAANCPTVPCGPGLICQGGSCVDPCAGVNCGPGSACSGGFCTAGGCHLTGCPAGEVCAGGTCRNNACAALTCPTGTFCRVSLSGATTVADCVRSCAYVSCAAGQACSADGFCASPAVCSPACGTGQLCLSGTCVPDPCAGVGCGTGQICSGGACVDDPCTLAVCPVGSCAAGQCVGQPPGGIFTQGEVPKAESGCGCGSAGGAELLGLGLAALALAPLRRRRPARRPRRGGAGAAAVLSALALGLGSGCGSSATTCPGGQTACGDACVDLQTSGQNCGTCARACNAGFICSGGGCVFPTGNPFLRAITPPSSGASSSVTLQFDGDGFQPGAEARFTGAGLDGQRSLTVNSATSATLPSLDLTAATAGAAQVRVVNPGQLISNAVTFFVGGSVTLFAVSPAGGRQDQTVATLDLTGAGFAPGVAATFTPVGGGAPQSLTATFLGDTHAQLSNLALGGFAVGAYRVTVTNPGGTASNALTFAVNEGAPILVSISPTSARTGTTVAGTASGQYLYPSSVAHVSGPGLADSPLPTLCAAGTDALGQCNGGQLSISADLTGIAAGSYSVTVVNPGSPSPLVSVPQTFQVDP